jgi:hypothetical protein
MRSRQTCFANSAVLTLRGHTILLTVMKRLHLVGTGGIIAVGVFIQSTAFAQEVQSPPTAEARVAARPVAPAPVDEHTPSSGGIWFNPLGLIIGAVGIDAGIALDESSAVNVGASYWSFDLLGVENTAFGFGAGWQYFVIGETFDGFFVLPNVQAECAKISFDGNSVSGLLVGPGSLIGYQWDWQPFSLRLGGGFHYYFGTLEATSADGATFSSDISGLNLDLDASIGFTW